MDRVEGSWANGSTRLEVFCLLGPEVDSMDRVEGSRANGSTRLAPP